MAFPLDSLAEYFTGSWQLTRRIRDRRALAGGRLAGGRLAGEACFTTRAEGLRYDERGTLTFGAHRGPASQHYLYRPTGGTAADVHFADGRFFHALDLAAGRDEIAHLCGDDLYRGRYRVLTADCWWLAWEVRGPRKDYLMATRYQRAG